MTTKSMVESAWAEEMGQFLYNVDPNIRKIIIIITAYIYIYIMGGCVCVCDDTIFTSNIRRNHLSFL